jgi:hypothetical protein
MVGLGLALVLAERGVDWALPVFALTVAVFWRVSE